MRSALRPCAKPLMQQNVRSQQKIAMKQDLAVSERPAKAGARGPNCWRCQYFGISYDPKLPYLCRLMGFKTKMLPAIEVLRADGQVCQGFSPKPVPAARTRG